MIFEPLTPDEWAWVVNALNMKPLYWAGWKPAFEPQQEIDWFTKVWLVPPPDGKLCLIDGTRVYSRPWWAKYDVPDAVLEEAYGLIGSAGR